MRSLRLRLILGVLGAIAVGFLLAGIIVGRVVAGAIEREFDTRLERMADVLASATDVTASGELELSKVPDDPAFSQQRSGWYWMIAGGERVLARSRSLWIDQLPIAGLRPGSAIAMGPYGERLRLVIRETTFGDRSPPLTIAVTAPADLAEAEIRSVVTTLIALLALVGAASAIMAAYLVSRGLAPLKRAADAVSRIATGEIATIAPSGYREIDPLVQAVNGLLAHARAIVERSRLQASNLAHSLKTPLAFIAARMRTMDPADRLILESIEKMTRHIDHHLKRARLAGASPLVAVPVGVRPVIDDILLVAARMHQGRSLDVEVQVDDGATFLGEREDLEELLSNLVDNAFKWADRRIRIEARSSPGRVAVSVDDDGPGLDDAARKAVLEPGVRLDEAAGGAGLGLSIARDLVENYRGRLTLDRSPWGGLRACVELPGVGSAGRQ